jgi:hypothetical protein
MTTEPHGPSTIPETTATRRELGRQKISTLAKKKAVKAKTIDVFVTSLKNNSISS